MKKANVKLMMLVPNNCVCVKYEFAFCVVLFTHGKFARNLLLLLNKSDRYKGFYPFYSKSKLILQHIHVYFASVCVCAGLPIYEVNSNENLSHQFHRCSENIALNIECIIQPGRIL